MAEWRSGSCIFIKNNLSHYTTEQIKERITILQVAEEFSLQVQKRGRSYLGLCPFHAEKTPSFSIEPQKNIFHCFGCGKKGDQIYLYALLKDISNGQAYSELAQRLGLGKRQNVTPEQKRAIVEASERYEDKLLVKKFMDDCQRLFDELITIRNTMRGIMEIHTDMEQFENDSLVIDYLQERAYHEYLMDGLMNGLFKKIDFEQLVDFYEEAKGVVEQWQIKLMQTYSKSEE